MTEGTTKPCPACGEMIADAARKCKHCGEFLVKCPRCSHETARGFGQCHACGASLTQPSPPPPPAPRPVAAQPARQVPVQQVSGQASELHYKRAIASTKSYVGAAFLSWLLYFIGFYIIGLIVNICYLMSASRVRRETGVWPSGRGCLIALIIVHFWIPLILGIILLVVIVALGIDVAGVIEEITSGF